MDVVCFHILYTSLYMYCNVNKLVVLYSTMLEITVSHWPFSDQFQHLADQNPFWSTKFPVRFQWQQQSVT